MKEGAYYKKWNKEYQGLVDWFYGKGGSLFFFQVMPKDLILELSARELDSMFFTHWWNNIRVGVEL